MKLSDHFTLAEFTLSQAAARLGLDNAPPPEAVAELRRLCETVLQPLRASLGRPIVVSSGYRAPQVNAAVGGAEGSDHLAGRAADIIVPGLTVEQVCARIATLRLPFRQLIDEFGPAGWTHVSIEPPGRAPRRQMLRARRGANGRTEYSAAAF